MFRSQIIAGILTVCGCFSWTTGAMAEEPKPTVAAEKPAGGRVACMLLVNGAVTDAVVKAANIEGHMSVEAPYVGTWHGFLKGMEGIQKGRLDPVEQGKIDVMLIGTLNCYPDAETWKNHLGLEDSTLAGFAALGVKNNPKFRIVWQTYLWPRGQTPKDGKKTLEVASTKTGAAGEPLKELEKLVDAINAEHGRQVVLISPVAVATMKLVEMVAEGKFPGLTDPADLWTEFNMHSNRHVLALTAYCNVATMYSVSPVGLKPDFSEVTYGGGGKGPGIQSMEGITDEQRAILQNIAWETVSTYRHAGVAVAEDLKSEPADKLPAGLRVMSGGHSWSTENSTPLCQAAGIVGHVKLNRQGLNSGRIEDLTPLLEKGEIDVYVWQHNSTGPEFPKFLPTLVELGPKHNPNFRVLMQMPWLTNDGRQGVKSPEEYEKTDLAEYQTKLEASRKQQEAYVDEVNAKVGKRVVFLVPLGEGMLEVRKMIVAGKFPGVTTQRNSVLAGDIMPHQGLLGLRLGTYMHFAALYQMSPEGLNFPGKEGDGLTDEQRPILQKLAWDMVSKYPYAGIARFEAPQPSKEGDETAPKPGDDAAAVPEALKGWKETHDLPADTVITDYNDYIEKLPKAERPGVSNVKYYVDELGRNAVAVLVNLGGTQWPHLLTYDKANKRTGVTKFAAGK